MTKVFPIDLFSDLSKNSLKLKQNNLVAVLLTWEQLRRQKKILKKKLKQKLYKHYEEQKLGTKIGKIWLLLSIT